MTKRNIFIFSFVSLVSCEAMAQEQYPVPVRSLAEKAAKGDVILGKENKKKKLAGTLPMLNAVDTPQKKEIHSKTKSKRKTK